MMAYYKFSYFCGQLSLTKKTLCYIIGITIRTRGDEMFIEIDFNSDEAIYVQLRNQIILGIATEQLKEGESLPSVRALAEDIGINMHTVNKAYATLKQDGFLKVDRRRGAVIAIETALHVKHARVYEAYCGQGHGQGHFERRGYADSQRSLRRIIIKGQDTEHEQTIYKIS